MPRRQQVRDEQLVPPPTGAPLHPVRIKDAARADRDCPTVTFATCLHMHARSVQVPEGDRKPGGTPLVGELRGVTPSG